VPCNAAALDITEEATMGQIALRTRSQWTAPRTSRKRKVDVVKADLQIETAYWNHDLSCLVCLRCRCRIDDSAWHRGKSAAGTCQFAKAVDLQPKCKRSRRDATLDETLAKKARSKRADETEQAAELQICDCKSANDLLQKPLMARMVNGKTVPFLYRCGSTTTIYCQIPRNRGDGLPNGWLKMHPKEKPTTPRTLALKVTETIQQGQKAYTTVYTGYIRIGAKNITEVNKDMTNISLAGAPLRPQPPPVHLQDPGVRCAFALLELRSSRLGG